MAEFILEQEATRKLVVLAALVVACLGVVLLAIAIAGEDVMMVTALLALVGSVVVFPFPRLAIVLVILFAQVQYLFTTPYSTLVSEPVFPVTFQWLDEVLLLCLLGNLTLTKLVKREPLQKAPALLLLAALFVVGIVSTRLNEISLFRGLVGQRYVFEMVILYLAIINADLDERFLKGLVYLLLAIGVFQAMVGFMEFASHYRLYLAGNHDIVQGTWGGGSANNIGVFFLCLSTVVLASLRRRWHGPKALMFAMFILTLVLTSCRSGIVLAIPMFLFVLREQMKDPRYWIGIAVAFMFLAGSVAFYYRNTDAEISRDLGGDEFTFQLVGRTSVIPIMSRVLQDNSSFPLLGTGPGTYLTPTGTFYGSQIFMQVESMLQTREVIQPFVSASYAVVWMEYGVVGLILFGVVLLRLFIYAWQQEKAVDSSFWKDYFRALQAVIFVYAIVGGIFPLWTHFQTNIYLWLFPAIGVRYAILHRQRAARAPQLVSARQQVPARLLSEPVRSG